ncbi:MAG TPA: cobalt-precorrin-6A reductase [Acidimicrobiales bacterium]|nr:cobalt-precorrin-6A reductase [Acidimicrobiales bacterium]
MGRPSVLLLAGTTEAAALARLLAAGGVDVVASFAGRTRAPAPLPCPVRRGGFGGADGLAAVLRRDGHDLLVDATHPFAAVMPHHAAAAARSAGVPRLRLLRPPWRPGPGDRWDEVDDLAGAARRLAQVGARRVLLTTGRGRLEPFAALAGPGGVTFVVRSIEMPSLPPSFAGGAVVLGRGPYDLAGEAALLGEHRIDTLVTRNSGGTATVAKLAAARATGTRVVMVRRPPQPDGPVVETAAAAADWVAGFR